MNDQDYIRRAVESADGFAHGERKYMPAALPYQQQRYKDALAAQLVRQVDALNGYSGVKVCPRITEIFSVAGVFHMPSTGPDRTMNTIKAIVDSGVLTEEGTT